MLTQIQVLQNSVLLSGLVLKRKILTTVASWLIRVPPKASLGNQIKVRVGGAFSVFLASGL